MKKLLIERTGLSSSSLQFKHPNTKGSDPGDDPNAPPTIGISIPIYTA